MTAPTEGAVLSRADLIQEHRRQQPRSELERKARKSHRWKQRLWTAEEIDLIHVEAVEIAGILTPARQA